jgi:hypothetical protein
MKASRAARRKRGPQCSNSSLKATWNALFHTSYSSFPLILPHVHALVAPVIMFRLKRKGYSNCRVDVKNGGLVVFADR